MPNTPVSYLVLPRLHPELMPDGAEDASYSLPAGALFLWPGLPHPPRSGVFTPDYPWSPAQAAACVADFERTGREGVRGAPVMAFSAAGALGAGDDVSPEERRALRELTGGVSAASGDADKAGSAEDADDADGETRRQAAQRVLLLAWLQEQQVLELRELERRVRRGRSALAGLLGEGTAPETDAVGAAPDDMPLPPWRSVLAAASVFLPRPAAGSGGDTAVLALDRDMAATLAALGADPAAKADGNARVADEGLPEGWARVRVPLGRVLGRGWAVPEPTRTLLFVYPSALA